MIRSMPSSGPRTSTSPKRWPWTRRRSTGRSRQTPAAAKPFGRQLARSLQGVDVDPLLGGAHSRRAANADPRRDLQMATALTSQDVNARLGRGHDRHFPCPRGSVRAGAGSGGRALYIRRHAEEPDTLIAAEPVTDDY